MASEKTCAKDAIDCLETLEIDETLNGLDQDDIRVVEAVAERLIQPTPRTVPYNLTK